MHGPARFLPFVTVDPFSLWRSPETHPSPLPTTSRSTASGRLLGGLQSRFRGTNSGLPRLWVMGSPPVAGTLIGTGPAVQGSCWPHVNPDSGTATGEQRKQAVPLQGRWPVATCELSNDTAPPAGGSLSELHLAAGSSPVPRASGLG